MVQFQEFIMSLKICQYQTKSAQLLKNKKASKQTDQVVDASLVPLQQVSAFPAADVQDTEVVAKVSI